MMQNQGFLLTENINNIIDIFDTMKYLAPPAVGVKITVSYKEVAWWEVYEEERRKKIEILNDRLKQALAVDDYNGALKFLDEAQEYIKEEDPIVFNYEAYQRLQEINEKIRISLRQKNYRQYFELLKSIHHLNPFSMAVKGELDMVEAYCRFLGEMESVENPYNMGVQIRKSKETLKQLPGYLQIDYEKKLNECFPIIEAEVAALMQQVEKEEKKGDLNRAHLLLSRAANIEFDEERKALIYSSISRVERKKKRTILLRYAWITLIAAIFITSYITLKKIQESQNKTGINQCLMNIQPLLENNQWDQLKADIEQIFVLRGKLKKDEQTDQNITGIMETIYRKLTTLPGNQKNNMTLLAEKARKAKAFFEGFPVEFTKDWIKESNRIIKLVEMYDFSKKSGKSAKTLEFLVQLKKINNEFDPPFNLLGQVAYTNSSGCQEIDLDGVKFVFIKPGKFEMGCFDPRDRLLLSDAPVKIKELSSFWISTTEITEGIYRGNDSNFPQNNVDWTEASDFARDFGKKYELKTDLPTEAQWEYAARSGGKKIIYPWGNTITCDRANYKNCSKRVKPVESYRPNPFGIYELAGNVREWCRDIYHINAYSMTGLKDPFNTFGEEERVVRGGSYSDGASALKTYARYSREESVRDSFTGFRIVIEDDSKR
jgi:formylglycine-generating enzyme required for sulfatase activity